MSSLIVELLVAVAVVVHFPFVDVPYPFLT